jgi:thiamine biosynthesis lipoprotein
MEYQLQLEGSLHRLRFQAMNCPCEVLLRNINEQQAQRIATLITKEVQRIENKFSRYRDDNLLHQINHSHGAAIAVDEECAALFDYAQTCHQLSEGRFDISSGILRRAWRFNGGDVLPTENEIAALMPYIGWDKVRWQPPYIQLADGMEIDLGGVGKEYAVDRSGLLLRQHGVTSALINYGGDTLAMATDSDPAWKIAIDVANKHEQQPLIHLRNGAIATSGSSERYLLKDGIRYSHILDPRNGHPVADVPRSVSVLAPSCLQAGMLATFAMLQGNEAEIFMQQQNAQHWIQRQA